MPSAADQADPGAPWCSHYTYTYATQHTQHTTHYLTTRACQELLPTTASHAREVMSAAIPWHGPGVGNLAHHFQHLASHSRPPCISLIYFQHIVNADSMIIGNWEYAPGEVIVKRAAASARHARKEHSHRMGRCYRYLQCCHSGDHCTHTDRCLAALGLRAGPTRGRQCLSCSLQGESTMASRRPVWCSPRTLVHSRAPPGLSALPTAYPGGGPGGCHGNM